MERQAALTRRHPFRFCNNIWLIRKYQNFRNSQIIFSGVFRISKRGGKCSLDTSAHTKGGANQVFQFFLLCKKKFFWPKGGWPNGPPKYASDHLVTSRESPGFVGELEYYIHTEQASLRLFDYFGRFTIFRAIHYISGDSLYFGRFIIFRAIHYISDDSLYFGRVTIFRAIRYISGDSLYFGRFTRNLSYTNYMIIMKHQFVLLFILLV